MKPFERIEEAALEQAIIHKAFRRAETILQKSAVDPRQFTNYSQKNIESDLAYVDRRKKQFQEIKNPEFRRFQELALIFEAMVHEEGELSEWFGSEAETVRPSEYDDIKNGVDEIVEFQESRTSASHLALAIDVTFSEELPRKFIRIKEEIESGKLTEIKYFHSEHLGMTGKLSRVPRVVVGVEPRMILELIELWLGKSKNELAIHPVQILLLDEIATQLDAFRNYAARIGKDDIARVYAKRLEIVERIREQKLPLRHQLKRSGQLRDDDRLFLAIEANAEMIRRGK